MHQPTADHAEHDSEDIWAAVCAAVRAAREAAGVAAEDVAGIGFDATCSLVVRDRDGGQLSVSTTGEKRWDTIVWLDHRALAEADECTATGHRGARLSSAASCRRRWQTPKLMWLKRHLPRQLGAKPAISSTSPTS